MHPKDRGSRRNATEKKAARQARLFADLQRSSYMSYDASYAWTLEPHRFAKRSALACNCRTRVRGRPKTGGGVCCLDPYRPSVRARIDGKRDLRSEIARA